MKKEKFNIKRNMYITPSLHEGIIEIANDNSFTYQNALRWLIKKGIDEYKKNRMME